RGIRLPAHGYPCRPRPGRHWRPVLGICPRAARRIQRHPARRPLVRDRVLALRRHRVAVALRAVVGPMSERSAMITLNPHATATPPLKADWQGGVSPFG